MSVEFTGRKDKRRGGHVVCGGSGTTTGGCGHREKFELLDPYCDKVAEIKLTEKALAAGWTSDFPAWWTAMVGHSHLCPECSAKARET